MTAGSPEPLRTDPLPRLTRFAWIPLAILAAATLVLVPLDPDWAFNPPLLFAGLNLLFASAVPFAVAVLAGRAFLAGGSWAPLLLGAGMLAFGLGSGIAATLGSLFGLNVNVTTHHAGAVLAGGCNLLGALFAASYQAEARRPRSPGAVLVGSYLAIGVAMGLVTLGAIDGFVPPLFIPGIGMTLLRQVILGAAVALLAVSALLLRIGFAESRTAFRVWYAYGLGLVTLGLFAVFFVGRPGSPLGWVGRIAQYFGGIYILVALLTVLRDYYAHGLSVGRTLAAFFGEIRTQYRPLVESSTDALVSLDAGGTVLFWNVAAQRLFGSTPAEVFGRDLADCIVASEDAEDFRRELYSLSRTPDGLVVGARIERELLSRSGRAFPAEIAFLGRNTPQGRVTITVIRDITERKQAELALRQANEALEARVQERTAALEAAVQEAKSRADELGAVFAAMTEAVMVYDAQGRPIKANREAMAAFGFDPIGSDRESRARALNLRYPDGRPVPLEDLPSRRAARGESVRDERFIQNDARGKDCIVRSSASPLFFNDRFIGTVSVWQDITEQERAAEQLRELSQRLTYHVDHSPLAVIEWGPDMRLTRWSGAAERIFGWTAAEVLGKRMEDFRWIYQEDQRQVTEVSDDLQAGANPRRFSANRNYRKDGAVIHCEWYNSSLLDEAGNLRSILSLVLDVTERVRAEEALQSVARFPDENPYPVLRVARDGTLQYANRTSGPLSRMWNCQVGQRLPAGWITQVADAYARGQVVEVEATCDEGRVYSCILTPIANAGYLNIYARDITERKQAEAALLQAHAELEVRVQERTAELSRAVETLERQSEQLRVLASELTRAEQRERRRLATILHDELQQLLSAAKLRVGLLGRVEDPQVQEARRELSELLQEALAHSRSLVQELSPPILATSGLPLALEWLARWMEEKHHLKVDVQLDATAIAETEDLTVLLFHAVRELLFNVVKHAQVESAHVELTPRDGMVQIRVSDAGVGFEPTFLRVEGGVLGGFGLFSIRQRLEILGGRLEIASAPGQGSRFTLTAPLQRTKAVSTSAPMTQEQPKRPADPVGPRLDRDQSTPTRVLVVDDHKVMRQGLIQLLTAEPDIEIVGEAADGEAAVALARHLVPDVVTMDVSMPRMSGIEATQRIHTECPGVRVIGLSMFEEAEQAAAMRDAGAVAYLLKSGPAEALLAAIRACRTGDQATCRTEEPGAACPPGERNA
jgi:PAS domain S-box-containing protein